MITSTLSTSTTIKVVPTSLGISLIGPGAVRISETMWKHISKARTTVKNNPDWVKNINDFVFIFLNIFSLFLITFSLYCRDMFGVYVIYRYLLL